MDKKINPYEVANEFNRRHRVGALVGYSEVIGEKPTPYRTRGPAVVLSGHTAVVWLVGKAGCVAVSHCVAAKQGEPEDTRTLDLFGEAEGGKQCS